jgi:hypothetical protein
MPWCHTCRIEYAFELDGCPECGGRLRDAPAPERRVGSEAGLVVVTTLPPEQALLASGRLDAGGITNALRDVTTVRGEGTPIAVEILVSPFSLPEARDVLGGRRRRPRRMALATYLFIVAAACVFLSGALLAYRWLTTGSPLP